jgi:hypothetical protein
MKTAQEVYSAYRIMPNLQMHQLRVAAVGKLICGNLSVPVDSNSVVLACLFHDMGNIIKFDLDYFPDFLEPEGREYWQRVKDEFVARYGNDEHAATNEIAREAGLSETVRALIDDTRFSRLEAARDGSSFESKILKYADLRAGPRGILSLADRLEEGRVRYADRKSYNTPEGRERHRRSAEAAVAIEGQLFAGCSIRPEDINDGAAAALVEELRKYPVA